MTTYYVYTTFNKKKDVHIYYCNFFYTVVGASEVTFLLYSMHHT